MFIFASEIKALLAHPAVPRESALDRANAGALSRLRLHPRAGDGLQRRSRRCRRGIASKSIAIAAAIEPIRYWTLPHPGRRRAGQPRPRARETRLAQRSAGRSGAPGAPERRAARRVPERRAGQQPDRRADAPPQQRRLSRPSASALKATPASTKPAMPAASPIICTPSTPPSPSSRRRSICCRCWSGITISPSPTAAPSRPISSAN